MFQREQKKENNRINAVTVAVPASTANVGVGFDACAFALSLYDRMTFTRKEEGLEICGCPEEFRNEDNMAFQTYSAVFAEAGKDTGGVRIEIEGNIPICRGLGSSAALLVGGAVAANEMLERPFSREQLLDICMRSEPHPDNIAAAMFGGFTSAVRLGEEARVFRSKVDQDLKFYAIIPDFTLSTAEARAILPKEVALADAVANISRATILVRAFESGDREMIKMAVDDRLHQPYRSRLIENYEEVRSAAFACGAYAYFISGAGPTCIAMTGEYDFADDLNRILGELGIERTIMELTVEAKGARIENEK